MFLISLLILMQMKGYMVITRTKETKKVIHACLVFKARVRFGFIDWYNVSLFHIPV